MQAAQLNTRASKRQHQRASNANRSTASRSESPSIRCSTITTATIIGGTERRPTTVNKSANISSGNRLKHSRCSTP